MFLLARQMNQLSTMVKINNQKIFELEQKIQQNSQDTQQWMENQLKSHQTVIYSLCNQMTQIGRHISQKVDEKRLPPANRKPRTAEERRRASEKGKAIWAARKEKEAQKKAQELETHAPRLIGEQANAILLPPF